MGFRNYFYNLSFFQKVELYLIVVLLYGVVWYKKDDIFQPKYTQIKTIHHQYSKPSNIKLVNLVEKYNKQFQVNIYNITFRNNQLTITFKAKFIDTINLINLYQKYFIIDYLILKSKDNSIETELTIDISQIYNPNQSYQNISIPNPFIEYKVRKKKVKHFKPIKILAIVDNSILVENRWYKKGDIVYGVYKIINIKLNTVILRNIVTKQQIIKKVYDE